MNADRYVNNVAKKIKCDGKKKKEIKLQLLTDINMRIERGEALEQIIAQMGAASEIVEGFNENISEEEKKKYRRNKVLKIVIPIASVLVLLAVFIYWMLPKGRDIEQSKYFNKAGVEAAMKETIELIDAGEFEALQEKAIPQMQTFLNEEEIDKVKGGMSDDWGERRQYGVVYAVEIVQGNKRFAVGEITVTYDNITVTYRLTYDKDMRLAGLYVR